MESPIPRELGTSDMRERRWGLIGGITGSLAGLGSATVAVGIDGAPLYQAGPYPSVFGNPQLLALDVHLLGLLLAGAGFSSAALWFSRRSAFPRSDSYGAGLIGLILSLLAGTILFTRLLAIVT
jgi:hypothetical protein